MALAERELHTDPSATDLNKRQVRLLGDSVGRPLTPRQLQVLQLTARGMTNAQIAGKLSISEETVKQHKSADNGIFRRLESDKAGVVFQSASTGVIDVNSLTAGYDLTRIFTLTGKELDVLEVLTRDGAESTSDAYIGRELNIPRETVKNRIESAKQKLGADNRIAVGLIFIAASENLVSLEDEYTQRTNDLYEDKPKDVPFSTHDIKTLNLLADGKTNKEIGTALYLEEKTIKNQLTKIYSQLNVGNALAAVLRSSTLGIADLREHNDIDLSMYGLLTPREREILDALIIVMENNQQIKR